MRLQNHLHMQQSSTSMNLIEKEEKKKIQRMVVLNFGCLCLKHKFGREKNGCLIFLLKLHQQKCQGLVIYRNATRDHEVGL